MSWGRRGWGAAIPGTQRCLGMLGGTGDPTEVNLKLPLSREAPVPSSPQPRRFPSLSGPLTPALTAEPLGKTPSQIAMSEAGRWGSKRAGGGAIQDRNEQLPALLSPFAFLPSPPTWLPATFSLFFLVAPFPLLPQGSGCPWHPWILLVLTQGLGQGVVD